MCNDSFVPDVGYNAAVCSGGNHLRDNDNTTSNAILISFSLLMAFCFMFFVISKIVHKCCYQKNPPPTDVENVPDADPVIEQVVKEF